MAVIDSIEAGNLDSYMADERRRRAQQEAALWGNYQDNQTWEAAEAPTFSDNVPRGYTSPDVIDQRLPDWDFADYGNGGGGGGGGSYLYGGGEPQWYDDGSAGGYYRDQWGNASYDGGATWGAQRPPSMDDTIWGNTQFEDEQATAAAYRQPRQQAWDLDEPIGMGADYSASNYRPVDPRQLAYEDSLYENQNQFSGMATWDAGRTLQDEAFYTPQETYAMPDEEVQRRAGAARYTDDYFNQNATDPGTGLMAALNWYDENIQRPISETGAQLTRPALTGLRAALPAAGPVGGLAAAGMDWGADRMGLDPFTPGNATGDLGEFGAAVRDSGGDPRSFRDIQNENFAERPGYQQFAASAAFDVTNFVPVAKAGKIAGLADDAFRAGRGANRLDDIARQVNRFTDDIPRAVNAAPPGGMPAPFVPAAATDELDPATAAILGWGDEAPVAGMRELPPQQAVTSARDLSTLPLPELQAAEAGARAAMGQASDAAERIIIDVGPAAPEAVQANRTLGFLEDNWERFSDELARRARQVGTTFADETGAASVDFARQVAGNAAFGAGVGAGIGAYASEGDWEATKQGALIGAAGGVVAKGGAAAANKLGSKGIAERAAARNIALGVPEAPPATSKLVNLIKAAKPVRSNADDVLAADRRVKAAKLHTLYRGSDPISAYNAAPGAMKGKLPVQTFDATKESFTPDELLALNSHIVNNPKVAGQNRQMIFTVYNTQAALVKVLAGELPTNGEIQLLEKAFGPELAKALLGKRSLGAKAWSNTMDALNMPRTLITAWDASAPLRQGAILAGGHPIASLKAAGVMVRAMASPEYAKYVDEGIQLSPNAPLYERMKIYFAPTAESAAVSAREEAVASRIAGRLPGVAGSQRGYTTYLNAVRQNVADNWLKSLSPEQLRDDKMLEQMGTWLNVASGRGKLWGKADTAAALTSGFLFAPRYALSRFQVPVELLRAIGPGDMSGQVRKEVLRDLTGFVATGVSILALGEKAGLWEVELDSRSTDFGKMRIGPTRIDFWAGEQQIARTIAQFSLGEKKSTSTGDIQSIARQEVLERWLRSKLSPAASAGWDLKTGETFIGEELKGDKATVGNQAFQRLMPLFVQGITEAWMEDGWKGGAFGAAAGTGIGVQTYFTNRDIENRVAGQMFDKPFLDLNKGEKAQVRASEEYLNNAGKFPQDTKVNDPGDFMTRFSEFKVELEAELKTKLDAGLSGKSLKDEVGNLKRERYVAAQALLGGEAVQKMLNGGTPSRAVIDALAEAYWSAPVKETVAGGEVKLDFGERDRVRADILAQVKAAGLDPNYITGTGLGTYRGERFTDPQVRNAVLAVEEVQEKLNTSGYWQIRDEAWGKLKDAVPGLANYEDYSAWVDAQEVQLTEKLAGGGMSRQLAKDEAARLIAASQPAKAQAKLVAIAKSKWILANPEEAVLAWEWEYLDPGKENGQEAFLNDWIKKNR